MLAKLNKQLMSLLKCPRCGNNEAVTISVEQENRLMLPSRKWVQCQFCKFEIEGSQLGDELCVP